MPDIKTLAKTRDIDLANTFTKSIEKLAKMLSTCEPIPAAPGETLHQKKITGKLTDTFDYQSVRHCSKTSCRLRCSRMSLITSQFDTAPKPVILDEANLVGLITSQFDTAPKLDRLVRYLVQRLITSQFDTAPKRWSRP